MKKITSFFLLFLVCACVQAQTVVTDNFPGTSLSVNWVVSLGGYTVADNTVTPNGDQQTLAYYPTAASSNDQFSCQVFQSWNIAGAAQGPVVRGSANSGYLAQWGTTNGTPQINLQTFSSGSYPFAGPVFPATVGHTYCVSAVGSVITITDNGAPIYTVTDTTLTTGSPGMSGYSNTSGSPGGVWTAGNGDVPPAFVPSVTTIPTQLTNVAVSVVGYRTNWTSGTTFSMSGVTGSTVSSATFVDATHFNLTINTGDASGIATLSDSTDGYGASMNIRASTTWYIRPDGGGRYDANRVSAGFTGSDIGCDGLGDAAYPGSGTNQHCAYNDYRFLWDDQTSAGIGQWVIFGGDTLLLRGCVVASYNPTTACRVGFNQGDSNNDVWCVGGTGNGTCGNPIFPSGTPSRHTRILGQNYANCSVGNQVDKTKLTEIYGGYGLGTPMYLGSAQYVDVQCLSITRHSQCITVGPSGSRVPSSCSTQIPIDDYDSEGIVTDQQTHDVYLQDLWVHGHTDSGIRGPDGGVITAQRVDIAYNSQSGWNFDDGCACSAIGQGRPSLNTTWNFYHSTIEWNGCNQEYPATDPIPVISCYAQSTAGYGDGVGTPADYGMTSDIEYSIFIYNTQDGLDLGHNDTESWCLNGQCFLTIINSYGFANMGGAIKWGAAFTTQNVVNNLMVSNGWRMSQPITGLNPNVTNNTGLVGGDMCRAGDGISFNFLSSSFVTFSDNTVVNYCPTSYDVQCNDSVNCDGTVFNFQNNITIGYDNPSTYDAGGQPPGPGGLGFGVNPPGTYNHTNNVWYHLRNCPGLNTGETCDNPQLVNQPTGQGVDFVESELDVFLTLANFYPSTGSIAIAGGVFIPSITIDYAGNLRPNPPSMGALEPFSAPPSSMSIEGAASTNGVIIQ